MKKVLISGAGVAGLTLAYWLKKSGFSPTIVERSPSLQKGGYKIDIRGSALEVVKRMGIHSAIAQAKTEILKASYVDREGRVLTEMAGDTYGLRTSGDLEIMRGDLCQILFDQLEGIECLFGNSITSLSETPQGIDVEFSQTPPQSFDLVIGADGLHSTVRKFAFGNEPQFLFPLGVCLSVFSIPNFLHLDRAEIEYKEPAKFVNVYCIKGSSHAKACFAFLSANRDLPKDRSAQQEILEKEFSDLGWETSRLLQEMQHSPDFYFDEAALIKMPSWSRGRVALVGDAGYAPSPMSGQGTSVALIGAYLLAQELLNAKGAYQHAFSHYELRMREFVKKNQALAEFGRKAMQADSSWISYLFHILLRILPGKIIHFLSNFRLKYIAKVANSISLD